MTGTLPEEIDAVFVFTGQGGIAPRQIRELYYSNELAREFMDWSFGVVENATRRKRFGSGIDLRWIVEEENEKLANKNNAAQPLSAIAGFAESIVLRTGVKENKYGIKKLNMISAAGHSVGVLPALAAAQAITEEEMSSLAVKRAEMMIPQNSGREDGAVYMAAVISKEEINNREVESACAKVRKAGDGNVHLANYNSDRQSVVSGEPYAIKALEKMLPRSLKMKPLKSEGPFHTEAMSEASRGMEEIIRGMGIRRYEKIAIPYFSSRTGRQIDYRFDSLIDMAHAIREPVNWRDTMRTLVEGGNKYFVECGGNVLSKFAGEFGDRVVFLDKHELLGISRTTHEKASDAYKVVAEGTANAYQRIISRVGKLFGKMRQEN